MCGSTQCLVEASDAYYEFCWLQAGSPFASELWQGSHLSIAGGVLVERWNARESRNREVHGSTEAELAVWQKGHLMRGHPLFALTSHLAWKQRLDITKLKVDISKVQSLQYLKRPSLFGEWFCCPRWSLPESLRWHLWHSWQHRTWLVGGDVGCRAVVLGFDKHGGFHSFRPPSQWTIKSTTDYCKSVNQSAVV